MGLHLLAAITLSDVLGYAWVIFLVAAGLGFVIFVHELGHFLVAKACGVKCEKFYIGFDVPIRIGPIRFPRTLGKFRWGETEYGIGIIPLGGYVKMLGQDDDPRNAAREAERIRLQKEQAQGGTGTMPSGKGESDAEFELDPRSYPAKSVPQRMAIISAGVIMNLIFAVVFATVAYMSGVLFTPCVVGMTAPGDPAWVAGMRPGDKIVQLARDEPADEHMRFDWELRQRVAQAGMDDPVPPMNILVRRLDGEEQWLEITPTDRMKKASDQVDFVTLGILPPRSTKLSSTQPVKEYMAAGRAQPPLQGGDRVIAVNGQPLPRDEASGQVYFFELEKHLARHLTEPITLTVERPLEAEPGAGGQPVKTVDVVVPPSPLRWLGLTMRMGPIVALQAGSPAAEAGFQPGDVIQSVDGVPVGDPLTLPQRVSVDKPRPIVFEVERQETAGQGLVALTVTPRGPPRYSPPLGLGARMSLDQLGIAYQVEPVVTEVLPGSPGAEAGLLPGDRITAVQWVAESEELAKQVAANYGSTHARVKELNPDSYSWPYVHGRLQEDWPELKLRLVADRGGKTIETEPLASVEADGYFGLHRGLRPTAYELRHYASSLGEATTLGLRETKEKLFDVFGVLGALATGRLNARNLVGPVGIATVAGVEASRGIPRLLLFLTLLSANLAILNFLPIPALDGGHMMFLIAEAVTGKPVDERVQGTLTLIGVVCLLGLMIFVVSNDIGMWFR
ncbi:MAG: site-2 protease family protein [Pirellulaceae bacterium]|nr:site-2 protease family protein [Pirellulaceae bacterium]